MDKIIDFIINKITGGYYALLVVVCIFLIFAIIGYLGKLKYGLNSKEDNL